MKKTNRRYEATVTAGGDTWEDLVDTLNEAIGNLKVRALPWVMVGPSRHASVFVTEKKGYNKKGSF